jgi:hypothetical protein
MSEQETTTADEPEVTPDGEQPITEEQVEEAEREGDEPAPADDEPDVIEQAKEGFSEREKEAGRKRIERAVSKMVTTLQQVLADEAEFLQPCPRCADDFPGLIWNPEVKQVLPQVRAAVMVSMGENPDPTLKQDPRASTCDRCDGYGKVSTGSKVARQDKLECEECKGRGWVGPRAATLPAAGTAVQSIDFTPAEQNGSDAPPTDPWGRVKGEPLYGVMPGFEQ